MPHPPTPLSLSVAILEYIFCLIGLSANFLVCCTILRYRKTTFSNTFYTLAVALAVPDCVHLLTEIFCALPAVFYGLDRTPKWFLQSCGFFTDASFFALAPLMLIIAVNRYVAVCYFETYKRLFTFQRIIGMIIFCFIFCWLVPSVMYGCKCYYQFNYAWLFDCKEDGCSKFALDFNATVGNSICLIVIIVYVMIAVQYRRMRRRVGENLGGNGGDRDREAKNRNKEMKLMFQFGLITAVLIVYQVVFWIFLLWAKNDYGEIVLNFVVNLNSCCSPFFYIIFSSEIRSRLPWKNRVGNNNKALTTNMEISRAKATVIRSNPRVNTVKVEEIPSV